MTDNRTYVDESAHFASGGTIEYRQGGKVYEPAHVDRAEIEGSEGGIGTMIVVVLVAVVLILLGVWLRGEGVLVLAAAALVKITDPARAACPDCGSYRARYTYSGPGARYLEIDCPSCGYYEYMDTLPRWTNDKPTTFKQASTQAASR